MPPISEEIPERLAALTWLVRGTEVQVDLFKPARFELTTNAGCGFARMCQLRFSPQTALPLFVGIDESLLGGLTEEQRAPLDDWLPRCAVVSGLGVLSGGLAPSGDRCAFVGPRESADFATDPQRADALAFRKRSRYDVLRVVHERLNAPQPPRVIFADEVAQSPRLTRLYSREDIRDAMRYWGNTRGFLTMRTRRLDFRIDADLDEQVATEVASYNWEEARTPAAAANTAKEYDVFICHASEDKDFVSPFAQALRGAGLEVWYDEFELTVGNSLRRSIDHGLARSRFGVVVLSPSFFNKEWPQKELDGLVQKEIDGRQVILPLWHHVSRDDVAKYSLTLADRVAVSTDKPLDDVVRQILAAVARLTE